LAEQLQIDSSHTSPTKHIRDKLSGNGLTSRVDNLKLPAWREIHPDKDFHRVEDGLVLTAGGIELHAVHTPGHSPGSVCWSAPALGAVVSGDTLLQGGPGATGRSYSSFPAILESISKCLGTLPDETVVYTDHGDTTTIGGELVHYDEWVDRGH
jgi:glyoxylase-like metal-dependent hydrolase (beta-lactamase superfamily II)